MRIDLSGLHHQTGSWHVADDGEVFGFVLNVDVCSPLRQLGYLSACPLGSAVCGLPRNSSAHAVSFGKHSTGRLVKTDKVVGVLEFSDGGVCAENRAKNYRTLIHLACTPGIQGASPRFFAYDNCVLHLEWHTSVMCPQGICVFI